MLYAVLALTAAALAQAQVSYALHTILSIWRMRRTGGYFNVPELGVGQAATLHVIACICKAVFLITSLCCAAGEGGSLPCLSYWSSVLYASLLGRRPLPPIDAAC